eukprot:g4087.t1
MKRKHPSSPVDPPTFHLRDYAVLDVSELKKNINLNPGETSLRLIPRNGNADGASTFADPFTQVTNYSVSLDHSNNSLETIGGTTTKKTKKTARKGKTKSKTKPNVENVCEAEVRHDANGLLGVTLCFEIIDETNPTITESTSTASKTNNNNKRKTLRKTNGTPEMKTSEKDGRSKKVKMKKKTKKGSESEDCKDRNLDNTEKTLPNVSETKANISLRLHGVFHERNLFLKG